MAILTKPVNLAFVVSEDKKDEFLNSKRDTVMLLNKFKRLKKIEMLQGKKADSPNIVFLTKKIEEFESELEDED